MRQVMPGDVIEYKNDLYRVGLVGSHKMTILKLPELDRTKAIAIKIESTEWTFN